MKKVRYENDITLTPNKPTIFVSSNGTEHRLISMICHALVTAKVMNVPVEKAIRRCEGWCERRDIRREDGTEFHITAVQVPGKDISAAFES